MNQTQNIWAVGRNYAEHAQEMKAEIPTHPLIFLKAGSTINTTQVIELPSWSNEIHHEIEVALLLDEKLNPSHVTLALDLTARDAQAVAKSKGQPWTLAKSFKGSCPLGPWKKITHIDQLKQCEFELQINQNVRQKGSTKDMIFNISALLKFLKDHFPLAPFDVVLTGTPSGVGPLKPQDHLKASLKYLSASNEKLTHPETSSISLLKQSISSTENVLHCEWKVT